MVASPETPKTNSSSGEAAAGGDYTLTISRLTIDKLGVKLYDKASAVVAELIANSYDADATEVLVELPLGTELASKDSATKQPVDKGYEITVTDNGHGMTPDEARRFYLKVGRDRRENPDQGARSRIKQRPVMGRKGIGKLSPFGICKRIEVLSSGGDEVKGKGYLTTHFFLDFDVIVQDTDAPVELETGKQDGTYRPKPGTTIRLRSFLPKRVPNREVFRRQIAVRYALADPGFLIKLRNTREKPPEEFNVEQFQVQLLEGSRVDVKERPVPVAEEEGAPVEELLPVTGWVGLAKEAYKNEEMAGVRIYARGKIVATTRDFEQPAGFTGEFTMRSYLVGEIHADWLDDDSGEDLIRTDRQSILWDSERGRALRTWGTTLIKEVAAASRKPRRVRKSKLFMEKARIAERAAARYGEEETVIEAAVNLGNQIGAFAAEDELADDDYVDGLAKVILAVAPHQSLVTAFKQISQQEDATLDELITLFGKTRIAEMASYSQIADERVRSVRELQEKINAPGASESDLQLLIASAPWLIRPDWTVLTQNQALKTFRDQFVQWWNSTHQNDPIEVAISYEKKRPDFTLIQQGQTLHLVELKAPGHAFSGADYERLQNYVSAFEDFWANHQNIVAAFSKGWRIELIADSVGITDQTQKYAYESFVQNDMVLRQNWNDFLAAAVAAHEEFLEAYAQAHVDEGHA
jgi:Histidine kinase-, DNA gyrase B-, and HSP90-like ATPase